MTMKWDYINNTPIEGTYTPCLYDAESIKKWLNTHSSEPDVIVQVFEQVDFNVERFFIEKPLNDGDVIVTLFLMIAELSEDERVINYSIDLFNGRYDITEVPKEFSWKKGTPPVREVDLYARFYFSIADSNEALWDMLYDLPAKIASQFYKCYMDKIVEDKEYDVIPVYIANPKLADEMLAYFNEKNRKMIELEKDKKILSMTSSIDGNTILGRVVYMDAYHMTVQLQEPIKCLGKASLPKDGQKTFKRSNGRLNMIGIAEKYRLLNNLYKEARILLEKPSTIKALLDELHQRLTMYDEKVVSLYSKNARTRGIPSREEIIYDVFAEFYEESLPTVTKDENLIQEIEGYYSNHQ